MPQELLESIFCLLLLVEAFSLQNVVEMLEEVVVSCWEVRWIWWMRENFVAQFVQLSKCWSYNVQLSFVVENWALSVDQCWLQVWLHLIELLSILLRCNGFTRIQKAIVDQTASKPSNSDYDPFLVQVCLWEVFWSFLVQPLSWSLPVVI